MSTKYTKLLMGVGTLALMSAGTAHAAGTEAGTVVSNTFELDYQVGGVDQPQITPPPGDETTFSVDRIVDLTVTAAPVTQDAAPGETGVTQTFTVTNDGNGTQAYDLDLVADGADEFDMAGTTVVYTVYTPDGAGGFTSATFPYTPNASGIVATPDVAPDGYIEVAVTSNVPAGQNDTDEANLVLVADTLEPTAANGIGNTPATDVTADTGANGEDTVETILADPLGTTGVAGVADDPAVQDGAASAQSVVVVASADITAVKTVALVDPAPGSDAACASATTPAAPVDGNFYLPGACVEYTITVSNEGGQAATDVQLADQLALELDFISLTNNLGGTATVDAVAPAITVCDGTNCDVQVAGGTVAAGSPATPTTSTLVIRARVK